MELRERIKPRFLSAEQRTKLIELLSTNPGHKIKADVPIGDKEAWHYAEQLIEAIRKAGWEVDGPRQVGYDIEPEGLLVTVTNQQEFTGIPMFLADSLKAANIPVGAAKNDGIPIGEIELRIGHKPPN